MDRLGLMCGVLVAVLVAPAATDGWIYRIAWMADDPVTPDRPLAWRQLTHAARQGLLMFAVCCTRGGVFVLRRFPPGGSRYVVPSLMIGLAIAATAVHRVARRSSSAPARRRAASSRGWWPWACSRSRSPG